MGIVIPACGLVSRYYMHLIVRSNLILGRITTSIIHRIALMHDNLYSCYAKHGM
jgi:hypothetical protein